MNRRVFVLGVLAFSTLGGCGSHPPLANTFSSAEALAAAVLNALAQRDRAALEALALNEREFRTHVWPDLPAARPERNLPFSYVWGDLRQKSQMSLSTTLARHGGSRYSLVGVTFEGETRYANYRVHRRTGIVVRTPSGNEHTLRVCGSMIQENDEWKVFSYVVD
jgi:hypothetical protein